MITQKKRVTDIQYNAVSKFTSRTKIDQTFDIWGTEDSDVFYDVDNDEYMPLEEGLQLLYECIAYPFGHEDLTQEESEAIVELFREYNIGDESRYEWLLSDNYD